MKIFSDVKLKLLCRTRRPLLCFWPNSHLENNILGKGVLLLCSSIGIELVISPKYQENCQKN